MASGWSIGVNRLFFTAVVPVERKTTYLAVYYAWIGLVGGIGPLLAGQLLDYGATQKHEWHGVVIDIYTLLFFLHIALVLAGGGVARGNVVGATDAHAAHVVNRPISPKSILATMYHLLGIVPHAALPDRTGLPIPIVPDVAEVVPELLA